MTKYYFCLSIFITFSSLTFTAQSDETEKQKAQTAEVSDPELYAESYDVDCYCDCCNELWEDCLMRSRSDQEREKFYYRFPEHDPRTFSKPHATSKQYPRAIDLAHYGSLRAKKQQS